MQQQQSQGSEFLGMDPLEALKLKSVALQGGGGSAKEEGNPTEDMAKQLAMAYASSVMMAYEGTTNVPAPQNYMDGTEGVPGQRTGQDTVPAMLSPGEAVIPASAAQDPANQEAIQGMVQEGQQDQGMAAQILQSLGLPMDPQLIAMIEDMLSQGVPPEQIVQQLQERMGQAQGGQEMPQEAPMGPQGAPMGAPMETMQEGAPMPQDVPMAAPMAGPVDMGMPQGLYDGTINVQGPLASKKQREQQKFNSDESRKDTAFQADQQRKNESHRRSMSGE